MRGSWSNDVRLWRRHGTEELPRLRRPHRRVGGEQAVDDGRARSWGADHEDRCLDPSRRRRPDRASTSRATGSARRAGDAGSGVSPSARGRRVRASPSSARHTIGERFEEVVRAEGGEIVGRHARRRRGRRRAGDRRSNGSARLVDSIVHDRTVANACSPLRNRSHDAWTCDSCGRSRRRSGNACSATSSRPPIAIVPRASPTSPIRSRCSSAGRYVTPIRTARTSSATTTCPAQWGGPNLDNVYKHARIDPSAALPDHAARCTRCEDFILAVRVGFMHMPEWGTLAEVTRVRPRDRTGRRRSSCSSAASHVTDRWIDAPRRRVDGVDPRVLHRLDDRRSPPCSPSSASTNHRRRHGCRPQNWPAASTTPAR